MPTEVPTKPPAIKAQKIAVVNSGGYVMWARAHYKNAKNEEKVLDWSGTYTNPYRHVMDLSTAEGITTGCAMWPEMAAMAGRWASGPEVAYAPNGHTVVFAAYGSTSNPWLEIIE
jgi:hypothetical protein